MCKRDNAKDVLIDKIRELENGLADEVVIEILKKIVLSEKRFQDCLTEEEREYLKSEVKNDGDSIEFKQDSF